jgi:hypothetical protein
MWLYIHGANENTHLHPSTSIVERSALTHERLLQLVAVHVDDLLALLKIHEHVQAVAVVVSRDGTIDYRYYSIRARVLRWKTKLWQLHSVAPRFCPESLLDVGANVAGDDAGFVSLRGSICTGGGPAAA